MANGRPTPRAPLWRCSDSGAVYKCHYLLTYLLTYTRRALRKQNVFSPFVNSPAARWSTIFMYGIHPSLCKPVCPSMGRRSDNGHGQRKNGELCDTADPVTRTRSAWTLSHSVYVTLFICVAALRANKDQLKPRPSS